MEKWTVKRLGGNLEYVKSQVIEGIVDVVREKGTIELEDVYLGEYRPEVSGYDEMNKIGIEDEEVVVYGGLDEYALEDFNVEELYCILENIIV